MEIEKIATSRVTYAISKTKLLSPYISEGDKEPSWDGHIYIYKNDKKRKEDLQGRIPVQIKGKFCKKPSKDRITFHVSIADLNNYLPHGVAYFVVLIGDDSLERIYYSLLFPIKIKEILTRAKGQKGTNIEFNIFPSDEDSIASLFINFDNDCKKQTSFVSNPTFELSRLTNSTGERSVSLNIFAIGTKPSTMVDYIFNNEICLYAKAPVIGYPDIPIDYINCSELKMPIRKNVCIDGVVYYDHFEFVKKKNSSHLLLGESILVDIGENNSYKFSVNLKGALKEQIQDLTFFLMLTKSKVFSFDLYDFRQNLTNNVIGTPPKTDKLEKYLAYLKEIQAVMILLNVKDELLIDYDNFSESYSEGLELLIDVLLHKKAYKNDHFENSRLNLCNMSIFNVYLPLIYEKGEQGKADTFLNILGQDMNVQVLGENGKMMDVSKYVLFKKYDYIRISSLYYEQILSSLKLMLKTPELVTFINLSLLEMLLAYDENTQNKKLLNMCVELSKWLLDEDNDVIIHKLNYLQVIKRQRQLNADEIEILHAIIEGDGEDETILTGAYLLLNNQTEAERHYKKIKDKEAFKMFPIYNFMDK